MDWFRWWHGSLNDPKFKWVARKSGQNFTTVITLWVAILEYASAVTQCDADVTRGSVTGFDCDAHDVLFDVDDGACLAILDSMAAKGLIVDGRIANWDKRQPKREDSSAGRTRDYRDRKRAAQAQVDQPPTTPVENVTVTHGDAPVTQCDAPDKSRGEEIREKQCGDGDDSGRAQGGDHATPHLVNAQTGEENPRPVQIRILLRQHGMPLTSNSAEVLDMVRLSVTDQEITETVDVFRQKKPGDAPNARYILSMITTAREKAAKAVASAGSAPDARASPSEPGQWWRAGASAIEAKGAEYGLKWRRDRNEPFPDFKVRVFKAAGDGPWRQDMLSELAREKGDRYAVVHEHFYGHPPIEVQA